MLDNDNMALEEWDHRYTDPNDYRPGSRGESRAIEEGYRRQEEYERDRESRNQGNSLYRGDRTEASNGGCFLFVVVSVLVGLLLFPPAIEYLYAREVNGGWIYYLIPFLVTSWAIWYFRGEKVTGGLLLRSGLVTVALSAILLMLVGFPSGVVLVNSTPEELSSAAYEEWIGAWYVILYGAILCGALAIYVFVEAIFKIIMKFWRWAASKFG